LKKICVIGPCGAGKSTLAKEIASILKIPLFHLDQLFWKENWQSIGQDALKKKLVHVMETHTTWIIDGNYSSSLELRIAQADTIIFLDYPRRIYFFRVLKRLLTNWGKVRDDMADGCVEKIDFDFLKFVWNFQHGSRIRVIEILNKYDTCQQFMFTSPKQTKAFLQNLK